MVIAVYTTKIKYFVGMTSKLTINRKGKMGYKSLLIGMSCVMASLISVSASASTIDFAVNAPTSGTISYDGSTALIGSGIDVDTIVGLSTPLNAGAAISCDGCLLNFTSGANTGGWDFGSGGTISIVGGVSAAGIAGGATLLSGTFDSASVFDVGGGTFNFKITGGSFNDTKHPDLLTYFGMPLVDYQGGLNISFNTTVSPLSVGDAFTSATVFSGNIVNSPVPVPAAVWLFGSGLLGLVGVARRKKA